MLSACATTIVNVNDAELVPASKIIDPQYSKQKDETGTVVIKRDTGFLGAACNKRIYIDGKPVAELSTGQKVELHLPKGQYVISSESNFPCGGGMAQASAIVETGKVIMFRTGARRGDTILEPTGF